MKRIAKAIEIRLSSPIVAAANAPVQHAGAGDGAELGYAAVFGGQED